MDEPVPAPAIAGPTDDAAPDDAATLAARLKTPLTPVVGLVEVFLRRWGDELSPAQVGLLRAMDREGRRVLVRLEEVTERTWSPGAASGPQAVADTTSDGLSLVTDASASGAAPASLEEHVTATVAELLRAGDGDRMLAALQSLVEACGGWADTQGRDALAALRTLPDELRVPDGREMTLGPVLRALCAAAVERASGELAPPRRLEPMPSDGEEQAASLVALDLGSLGAVRTEFGDPGARWLVEKLRRTLRSLLRQQDGALRYPASRFLVRLGGTTPSQARHFARRLAWEWDAYLGQRLSVRTQVEPIRDGDLTASLRRVSFRPDDG